jgi:hypothetical protein
LFALFLSVLRSGRSLIAAFVPLTFLALPASAFADAVNPDVEVCIDRAEGDACAVDSFPLITDGACVLRNQRQCDPNYYECISHIDDPGCGPGSGAATGSGEGSGDCVTEAECASLHCTMVDRLVCEQVAEGSGEIGDDDKGGCAATSGRRVNTTGVLSLAFGALLVWSARRRRS